VLGGIGIMQKGIANLEDAMARVEEIERLIPDILGQTAITFATQYIAELVANMPVPYEWRDAMLDIMMRDTIGRSGGPLNPLQIRAAWSRLNNWNAPLNEYDTISMLNTTAAGLPEYRWTSTEHNASNPAQTGRIRMVTLKNNASTGIDTAAPHSGQHRASRVDIRNATRAAKTVNELALAVRGNSTYAEAAIKTYIKYFPYASEVEAKGVSQVNEETQQLAMSCDATITAMRTNSIAVFDCSYALIQYHNPDSTRSLYPLFEISPQ
jgi:hypothetical protein